ncbi:MAG: F0F1 ATP synthase subunit A [Actinomycetota bacterium]|nr:F0F1 ATP synthase subunit A [Actinomycetota bacterium]
MTRKIFGFSVNVDDLFAVVLAGLIIVALGVALRARVTSGVPGKLQLAFETIVGAVENQVRSTMGERGLFVIPLAVTLFVFILICNWLEMLPTTWPGHHQIIPAPTGDINLTAALAVLVILLVHFTWVWKSGFRSYVSHYFKPNALFFPINVVEEIAKPLTLALRLFGNIFAGGIMLVLIADMPAKFILPIPVLDFVWKLFDGLFVGPVQAFIFTLLTILYFDSAIAGGH